METPGVGLPGEEQQVDHDPGEGRAEDRGRGLLLTAGVEEEGGDDPDQGQ
jgi:hypothetical protein